MSVETFSFGALRDGTAVTAARITLSCGASVTILDYGATIQSLCVPDRNGKPVDVVLGYDDAAGYEAGHDYYGATIGRVGNRIGGAQFSLDGKIYTLAKNDGENHLHGGVRGFNCRMWNMSVQGNSVVCERLSPDEEEGYPGNLRVRVTYTLTEEGLSIVYDAESDRDTLVNLTNHAYFNLNGGGSVLDHTLQVFAERFCENDEHCLPTGKLLSVVGTPFDFREAKPIGRDIGADHEQLHRAGGYDHNFCLAGKRAAVLYSPQSGVEMTTRTDMPGMQVYSANFLSGESGKGGRPMERRSAVCLETQLYPNAMNCYAFPSPVLRAGRALHSETAYLFAVR